jgi:hypothetical protein
MGVGGMVKRCTCELGFGLTAAVVSIGLDPVVPMDPLVLGVRDVFVSIELPPGATSFESRSKSTYRKLRVSVEMCA